MRRAFDRAYHQQIEIIIGDIKLKTSAAIHFDAVQKSSAFTAGSI
jgi:hypothetical protein